MQCACMRLTKLQAGVRDPGIPDPVSYGNTDR